MTFAYSNEFIVDLSEAFPDESDLLKKADEGDILAVERFLKKVRVDLYQRARDEWAARNATKKVVSTTQETVNG